MTDAFFVFTKVCISFSKDESIELTETWQVILAFVEWSLYEKLKKKI